MTSLGKRERLAYDEAGVERIATAPAGTFAISRVMRRGYFNILGGKRGWLRLDDRSPGGGRTSLPGMPEGYSLAPPIPHSKVFFQLVKDLRVEGIDLYPPSEP